MSTIQEQPKTLKYWTVVEYLRDQVSQNFLQPEDRAPSLAEMQSRFGISRATVEKAYTLLEQEGLLIREQGRGTFVTKPSTKPQHVIAVSPNILSDRSNPYWSDLLRGVSEGARQNRTEVIFSLYDTHNVAERADGLIIVDESPDNFGNLPEDFPFVCLIVPLGGVDCVLSDDRSGFYQLTEHLIRLGHRRIASIFLCGPGNSLVDTRYAGYQQALQAHGIAYDTGIVRVQEPRHPAPASPNNRYEGAHNWRNENYLEAGYEAMKNWLDEGWAASGCTALVAHNDSMAMGVIRALKEAGLRVPEDVSVTGYDGTPAYDHVHPRLTTVHVPLEDIGRAGLEVLLRLVRRERDVPALTFLPVSLVPGESTGPCPQ